jgi:hypothetical protein
MQRLHSMAIVDTTTSHDTSSSGHDRHRARLAEAGIGDLVVLAHEAPRRLGVVAVVVDRSADLRAR